MLYLGPLNHLYTTANVTMSKSNKKNLNIVTWNIASTPNFVTRRNNLDPIKKRLPKILKKIKTDLANVDVLMLNEVFLYRAKIVTALKKVFPYHVHLGKNCCLRYLNSGLLTLSKLPFQHIKKQFFHHYGGWDHFTSKGFIAVQVKVNHQRYHIINTHMQQGDNNCWNTPARIAQGRQIAAYVNHPALKKHRIVFGGDLNMGLDDIRAQQYKAFVERAHFDEPNYVSTRSNSYIVRFLTKRIRFKNNTKVKRHKVAWSLSDTDYLWFVLTL